MPNQSKQEVYRVKSLYRPVVDLDNGGVRIEPNFKEADEALDILLQQEREKAVMEKVGEIRKQIEYLGSKNFDRINVLNLSSLQPTNNNKEE